MKKILILISLLVLISCTRDSDFTDCYNHCSKTYEFKYHYNSTCFVSKSYWNEQNTDRVVEIQDEVPCTRVDEDKLDKYCFKECK